MSQNFLVFFVDAFALALVFAARSKRLRRVLVTVALELDGGGSREEKLAG